MACDPEHCVIWIHSNMKNRLYAFPIIPIEIGYRLQTGIEKFCVPNIVSGYKICIKSVKL